jgi:hypothetical protein
MFGHPSQHQHMMKGVAAAVKSCTTPKHLKTHLKNRLAPSVQLGDAPMSTMGPDGGDLMQAARRTPDFSADDRQKAVNHMEESLAQEALSGGLKRDVGRRGLVQLQRKPPMSRLMKRAVGRGAP